MDESISSFPAVADDDLMLCEARGIAWQRDMASGRVDYDAAYLRKIGGYDRAIADRVNDGRCALLARHIPTNASLLDFGAGDGEFMRRAESWGFTAYGFEVIHDARRALLAANRYDDDPGIWDAVTMWDTIEHMAEPGLCLRRISLGAFLFVSVPIFADLRRIRESRHYRPGEHLYYWTAAGFIDWLALYGFCLLEQSDHEMAAGRESIGAFAFRRDAIGLRKAA